MEDIEDLALLTKRKYIENDAMFDVAIIGAGAVGCAIARELSRWQLRVLLMDKGDDVAGGASKSNSGIVHGGYDERHGTLKSRVARRGNSLFAALDADLHFGFRVTGSLVLAFSAEDVKVLEELLDNGRRNGVADLSIISRDQILRLEPNISSDVVAALYCPSAGVCSPYEYTIALAENAQMNGVEVRLSHEVLDIQKLLSTEEARRVSLRGGYFIRSSRELAPISANIVINCAGVMADKVAAMVGANNFSINPRKGEYLLLDRTQGALVNTVLFPVPSKSKGKGVLVSPTFHGNLLLGPTSRGIEDGGALSNAQVAQFIISNALRTCPRIDVERVITSYSGMRAKCDRGDFIIEESAVAPGFINVAGIDSPGLTSSPAVALLVVDILRDQCGLKLLPKPHFIAQRQPIMVKKPANFDGRIDDANPEKNIICRCERVTEAEIVDAIGRGIPALSTDMVKRRTRAGMGMCQGTFCENRVAALISREKHIPFDMVGRHSVGSSLLPHRRVSEDDKVFIQKHLAAPVISQLSSAHIAPKDASGSGTATADCRCCCTDNNDNNNNNSASTEEIVSKNIRPYKM